MPHQYSFYIFFQLFKMNAIFRFCCRAVSRTAFCLVFGALCFLVSNAVLFAQTPPSSLSAAQPSLVRFGVFGGVSFNQHLTNFTDIAQSGVFPSELRNALSSQINSTASGGLFVELPIYQQFGIALRGSLTNIGSLALTGSENLLAPPVNGGSSMLLQVKHTLNIHDCTMLAAEPHLTFRMSDVLTFYAGVRIGSLFGTTFSSEESIPEDSPYRFIGPTGQQTTTRLFAWRGAIPQLNSLQTALSGGISIEIPLDADKHWFVAAEGFYMYGLTQIANGLLLRRPVATYNGLSATRTVPQSELGTDRDPLSTAWPSEIVPGSWLMNNVRAGLSLRFAP